MKNSRRAREYMVTYFVAVMEMNGSKTKSVWFGIITGIETVCNIGAKN